MLRRSTKLTRLLGASGEWLGSSASFHAIPRTSTSDSKNKANDSLGTELSVFNQRAGSCFGRSPYFRCFSAEPVFSDQNGNRKLQAMELLQSISAMNLREALDAESNHRLHMPYSELIEMAKSAGVGATDEEADKVCEAFIKAGVVLRYKDVIYLKPDEVAEIVLQNLPDTEADVLQRIEQLKREIGPLEETKRQIEQAGQQRTMLFLGGGLGFMVVHFGLFFWLTYYELSWDVMEPLAYFVSLGYGIGAYMYFLSTHEDFGFPALRDRLTRNYTSKALKVRKFDQGRYEKLLRDVKRYQRYLVRTRP